MISSSRRSPRVRGSAAAATLLLALALLASGCGTSGDARALLGQAFRQPLHSAEMTLELQAALQGAGRTPQPLNLKLAGPYQSNGGKRVPSFNWSIDAASGTRTFSAGLISTGDNVYLTFGGASYEVGTQQVAQLNSQLRQAGGQGRSLKSFGIDPNAWVTNATDEGTATVAGVQTTHVRAGLDVAKMLHDVNKTIGKAGGTVGAVSGKQLSDQQINQVQQVVKNPTFDVYVGTADKVVRRVAVSLSFHVPASRSQRLNGLQSGNLALSIEFANVGGQFSFAAPPNAQPISGLLSQLGAGGALSGGSGSGGSSGANAGKLQAYAQCVQHAGTSAAALQRCAQLLR